MKKAILNTMISGIFLMSFSVAMATEKKELESVIRQYASNADRQDHAAMHAILHDQFRSIGNRLFGSNEVSLLDKITYLGLLKDKKIGGDKRAVKILSVDIQGNNAMAKVLLEGQKLKFTTYMQFVKTLEGKWMIISDLPEVIGQQ